MTPTPVPVGDFGGAAAGVASALTNDPFLVVLLTAAVIVGIAFYIFERSRRIAEKI